MGSTEVYELKTEASISCSLMEETDSHRVAVQKDIAPADREKHAQFLTPPAVSKIMASMFKKHRATIRLLDPGAGVGSLTAAFISHVLNRDRSPTEISATLFEIDPALVERLRTAMRLCEKSCSDKGITFSWTVLNDDFVRASVELLNGALFSSEPECYDCIIMNPPYRKILASSKTRERLRSAGIETSNLYAGFIALAARQLRSGGELVAISPRSFCNGPYFHHFRRTFLGTMALTRIHLFESRKEAFKADGVLQENVIIHAVKSTKKRQRIMITVAQNPNDTPRSRKVPYDRVVHPEDPNMYIHIPADGAGEDAMTRISQLPASLADLGLTVSTGRVVDFRAKNHLRQHPGLETAPLIYPGHFAAGSIHWPSRTARKPNAIVNNDDTADLLVPPGVYVLVKRFSAKEERRRIVAALYDSAEISNSAVGFENHLNYYHRSGRGMERQFARGLTLFLNSSIVDTYFRQFSGHTQVNAADLRRFRYPSVEQLLLLADLTTELHPGQEAIDSIVEDALFAER